MIQRCFKKLKTVLPYDPTIPLLGIYAQKNWNRYLHTHVHSTIHNMQEVEATVQSQIGEQSVIYSTLEYQAALKRKELLPHAPI